MDATLSAILLGIVSNSFYEIVPFIYAKGKEALYDKRVFQNNHELNTLIEKSSERTVDLLNSKKDFSLKNLELFLSAPEVEELVRHIYSVSFLKDEDKIGANNSLSEQFLLLFELYYPSEKNPDELSTILFETLIENCNSVLKIAIEKEILSAHEASSNYRFNIIQDHLNAIQKSIHFLESNKELNLEEITEFEKKYRKQVEYRHSRITIPNFDRALAIHIKDLFVDPKITVDNQKNNEPIDVIEFFRIMNRAVILGNPGGGKSTFSQKICYDLTHFYSNRMFGSREITPILVILRDYGVKKKENNFSIIDFIESTSNTTYQST